MGPTASGKTALALELGEDFPMTLISVDSAMVYRGLDIGAAKPSAAEQARAPHRLIDIAEPAETYSAARFRADALREMRASTAQGRIPFLVGGTLLYFRALLQGLAQLPDADPDIRARLAREAAASGLDALHDRLRRVDPASAARIHPHDAQRIQRALEVYERTGRPLTVWHREAAQGAAPYRVLKLALATPDRGDLHARIAARFRRMLQEGLIEEVQALRRRGDVTPACPALRAVGYRQVHAYLEGRYEYEEMVTRAIAATRQLAKRQLTWLRSEPDVVWISADAEGLATARARIAQHVPVMHRISGKPIRNGYGP